MKLYEKSLKNLMSHRQTFISGTSYFKDLKRVAKKCGNVHVNTRCIYPPCSSLIQRL